MRSVALVLILALTACGGGSDDPPTTCAEGAGLCAGPLGPLLGTRLEAAGYTLALADGRELCRRMTLDLAGRLPTVQELQTCDGESPGQMASRLMASAEYEAHQRRTWAHRLGYDTGTTVWWQNEDLDRHVGRMVRGELGYGEFASLALTHPAFFVPAKIQGDYETRAFETFLGRPARADEIRALRPLVGATLEVRQVCDGRVAELQYQECLAEMEEEGEGSEPCMRWCYGEPHEGVANQCGCPVLEEAEELGQPVFGCAGAAFGTPIDLGAIDCEIEEEADIFVALTARTAGDRNVCEDLDDECWDLALHFDDDDGESFRRALPLKPAPEHVQTRLTLLGEALTSRDDFWEAAVDRELAALLGWWQTSFRQPDTDLPEVRAALTAELRRTGSLRRVRELIVTSLLYTMPAAGLSGVNADDHPAWSAGPSKFLAGERWLDAVQGALGDRLWGACDLRFLSVEPWYGYEESILSGVVEEGDATFPIGDLYEALEEDEEAFDAFEEFLYDRSAYHVLAGEMGGCRPAPAPTVANLAVVSAQTRAATTLCALSRGVGPADADDDIGPETLQRIADFQAERLLSARPGGPEAAVLREGMQACAAAGECTDGRTAARWSCVRVLDSTAFAIY